MEKEYQFIRIINRKNKENKLYHLALVLFNRANDSDLLRILVSDDVVEYLEDLEDDDITDIVKIEYNSYQKQYEPKIKI